jgi:hypothetical protein
MIQVYYAISTLKYHGGYSYKIFHVYLSKKDISCVKKMLITEMFVLCMMVVQLVIYLRETTR